MPFYGVYNGRNGNRVYQTWDEADVDIRGMRGVKYKKFINEEDAKYFAQTGEQRSIKAKFGEILVWTDGSFMPTQKGGYVGGAGIYILCHDQAPLTISAPFVLQPTSNRCELYAFIRAMEELEQRGHTQSKITVFTDSKYTQKNFTENLTRWMWSGKLPEAIKNQDLWLTIYQQSRKFKDLTVEYTAGHKGNKENELVDKLAKEAAFSQITNGDGVQINIR
jgi:ribonuclease HI